MSIKLLKISTSKPTGLFCVCVCVTTLILSCHVVTRRWQEMRGSSQMMRLNEWRTPAVQSLLQQQRQRRLEETCSVFNDSWSDPGTTFIVSHDLRMVFCLVGKAACTSWLRVLLQLTGSPAAQLVAATDRCGVHRMYRFYLDPTQFENFTQLARFPFKDYYKFMFVREPLERLVSAYRDKMFRASEYVAVRQSIVGLFRRQPSLRSLNTGDDVTFGEFVQHVLLDADRGHAGQRVDHHWRPQYDLCQPCHINYDFIGHYETLAQDAQHVLSRLSNNTDVQFPASDLDSRNRNSHDFLQKFYASISTRNILRLLRLYKRDYEVFGYKVPDVVRQILH